jgi:hypothetical protein
MKKNLLHPGAIIMMGLLFTSCRKDLRMLFECQDDEVVTTTKIFATGFNNPRGLEFGPDGYLYVAEGGKGGSNSTVGICDQVIPPVGPYTGSTTGGAISRVSPKGERTVVTDKLPSSQTAATLGSDISGVADVAFIGDNMYALLAGAGCSHGVASIPNAVIKVNQNGTWKIVADLSAYLKANPVKNPEPDDFEPDGSWYSLVSVGFDLYAMEPNHGDFVKVTTDGQVKRLVDISASQGHIVPTAVALYKDAFYVGNLNTFPIQDGSSKILKITPDGKIKVWATGFTTVLGLAFDKEGRLYVLENTVGNLFPTPGAGQIVRINSNGSRTMIATGLTLPTGLTIGKDGNLYVSNVGLGPNAIGGGQILQISVHCKSSLFN